MSVRRVAARCLELGSARRALSSATGPPHRTDKDTQAADVLRQLEEAAAAGDADSQYQLSGVYEYGHLGVEESEEKALRWMRAAAEV